MELHALFLSLVWIAPLAGHRPRLPSNVFRPGIFSEYHGINQIGDQSARALPPLQTSHCAKRWALRRLGRTTADAKRDTPALSGSFSALCYSPQAAVIPLIYTPLVYPKLCMEGTVL